MRKIHRAVRHVATPAAIAALASPARQELVDTLEALGGAATIAALAAELGRPADGLYYHARRLVRAGLLALEPRAGGDVLRIAAARGRGRDATLALDYRPGDPRNAAAVRRVVASMLRIARRDFERGLARPGVAVRGPRRALWAARGKGWVTGAELAELNALLTRVTALLRRPRRAVAGEALVSVCFVLTPSVVRPVRRGRAAPAPTPARRARVTPAAARRSSGGAGRRRRS